MPRKKRSVCPFWSPSDRTCNIALEGLFIPPDDHIEIYCKTADHPLCAQYNGQMSEEVAFYCCVAERRRRQRIVSGHRITIVKPPEAGREGPLHFLANTIDLSTDGMRLYSKVPLSEESVVNFSFDDSFPKQLRSGHAVIRWCLPQLNSSGYQAGLSFKEEAAISEMDRFLDQASH